MEQQLDTVVLARVSSKAQEDEITAGLMSVTCPEMIPLDVAQTFFPLMVQKLHTIQQR